ncbi:hypothetical protein SS50377_22738 [Spironucleus salmonicida]|uniref:Uncharacterized protein n=1 Tax=Spironucleus salmonicida TaxID=348837 RepID=A0A9P8LV12_9EUKA|nr:hypothetical protein SS50377_22733 [Spironucleus salmonicida]KAH0575114.1 hypothetical protein SS50377_22738 [Spironucleus salmonicida]
MERNNILSAGYTPRCMRPFRPRDTHLYPNPLAINAKTGPTRHQFRWKLVQRARVQFLSIVAPRSVFPLARTSGATCMVCANLPTARLSTRGMELWTLEPCWIDSRTSSAIHAFRSGVLLAIYLWHLHATRVRIASWPEALVRSRGLTLGSSNQPDRNHTGRSGADARPRHIQALRCHFPAHPGVIESARTMLPGYKQLLGISSLQYEPQPAPIVATTLLYLARACGPAVGGCACLLSYDDPFPLQKYIEQVVRAYPNWLLGLGENHRSSFLCLRAQRILVGTAEHKLLAPRRHNLGLLSASTRLGQLLAVQYPSNRSSNVEVKRLARRGVQPTPQSDQKGRDTVHTLYSQKGLVKAPAMNHAHRSPFQRSIQDASLAALGHLVALGTGPKNLVAVASGYNRIYGSEVVFSEEDGQSQTAHTDAPLGTWLARIPR